MTRKGIPIRLAKVMEVRLGFFPPRITYFNSLPDQTSFPFLNPTAHNDTNTPAPHDQVDEHELPHHKGPTPPEPPGG